MTRGKFIVIEGGEGAGKSSQLAKLKEIYNQESSDIVFTREPGGSPYAEEIRNVILKSPHAGQAGAKTHFALFWAARADHLKNTIIPALEAGKDVICDRFDSSTFAYQIYAQEAIELKDFFKATRTFYLGRYVPDLYILLDVSPEMGIARKHSGTPDDVNHFDTRTVAFHTRMREGLHEFFKTVPHALIDANQSFDKVTADLLVALKPMVG